MKQPSKRRSVQASSSIQREIDAGPGNLNGTSSWYEQNFYLDGRRPSAEADFADLVNLDQLPSVSNFNGWDEANLQPLFSSTSLNSAPAVADTIPISAAPSITTDGREDSEENDEDKDYTNAMLSQLSFLSQRATRTMRRLLRPGRAPLAVTSPEVNQTLEDTNTLIRIMKTITAPDRDNITLDLTTASHGLVLSTLACHQHLVALFQAICNAIQQGLQCQKEHQQQQQQRQDQQDSDIGPSSVAQFVMILQLLKHLINRIDCSLFQNNPLHGTRLSTSGPITPVTPNAVNDHRIQSETTLRGSPPHGGLLVLVQDILWTIPDEHEKLRQIIQKLQTEIERSELH